MGKIYAYIAENRVREIIKSEGIFENVPIEERYTKEIVDNCVECDESITEGMDYNYETGEFTEHIEPEPEIIEEQTEVEGEIIETEEGVEVNGEETTEIQTNEGEEDRGIGEEENN